MDYIDARCLPRRTNEVDDTCRLHRAADLAAHKVLWIAPAVVLDVSPRGEATCSPSLPPPADGLKGTPISSGTIVTGGGTIRLKVFGPDDAERHEQGFLLKIADASGVTISGLQFDGGASRLQCPPDQYGTNSPCEFRHAIAITGASSDITLSYNALTNLVGDGVAGTGERVLVLGNTFSANATYRNRAGVTAGTSDVTIDGNTFTGMGRDDPGGQLIPMPGAIDYEPDSASQSVQRVKIVNNDITGWEGCKNQGGISASNHVNATVEDFLIDNNEIRGCMQLGILVKGSGEAEHPIVVTNNVLETSAPPSLPSRYGIMVVGDDVHHRPSYAHVEGNRITGAPSGEGLRGMLIVASRTVVAKNRIRGARLSGISFGEEFGDHSRFTDPNQFCGNLFCSDGYEPWESALTIAGSGHAVSRNYFGSSPRAVTIEAGTENVIFGNIVSGVSSCASVGCFVCEECSVFDDPPCTSCQTFDLNSVPVGGTNVLTNCVQCP